MLDVTVLLLSDSFASTAIGAIEVFHSAGLLWNTLAGRPAEPLFNVTAASVDGSPAVSPYGLAVAPPMAIADIAHTDIVVIPSSGLDIDAQLARYAALVPWLRARHAEGAWLIGVCSGAAFLAEAGLLDGRRATTYWAMADEFAHRYPRVDWRPDLMITEDERILCSGGVYAAIDVSIYLVEKLGGREAALNCAKALVVDMPRTHQAGYAVLPLSRPHADARIRAIEDFIQANYARDLPAETLAARAAMSPRTFVRRFKQATGRQPGAYVQTLRISVAKAMLEDGAPNLQAVSACVGYDDVAFFRALFKRHTGMNPGEYRRRFGPAADADAAPPRSLGRRAVA